MKLLTHYLQSDTARRAKIVNWRENHINDSLFYSYRSTAYDKATYPADFHYHEYYEVVILLEGDIHYVCESEVYHPASGDIILIPPGKLHMSRLNADTTVYKRHVFYFYPDAFDGIGCGALTERFGKCDSGALLALSDASARRELLSLLEKLNECLEHPSKMEQALALGYILRIFYLLNTGSASEAQSPPALPQGVLELQRYIDTHYAEIGSVTEVAEHFFYSREYVSRLFRKHFNTTVSDYIRKRRIAASRTLIAKGVPLIDVCYATGFGNLSTFIRAFHSVAGMTPSQYRRMISAHDATDNKL